MKSFISFQRHTHTEAQHILWWKMTHLPGFCCLSLLFRLLLRGSGSFSFESLRSHSSRFPASQLPRSLFYWYRLVYSINFLDSIGSFSFSSLCLIFIFPYDSSNPWFPVLCLPILHCFLHCFGHTFIPTGFFFFLSICQWCFSFSPNKILLWSFSLFTLTSSSTLTY